MHPFAKLARFVWYDSDGVGRNRFASFRLSFELEEIPDVALLHLFADNAYQLFVNGSLVQVGPVRFDRLHPQYDSIDLSEHLGKGRNVLAVRVKSFGCKTFKDNSLRGGFIAWGSICAGGSRRVDFATTEGSEWRVKRCVAFCEDAVKMSFALDPIDIFSQADEDEGWQGLSFDDSAWRPVVEIGEQGVWGSLEPRSIEAFDLAELDYEIRGAVLPLEDRERIVGFTVPSASFHFKRHFAGEDRMAVVASTFVYSPCDQSVCFGGFWKTCYVNGERIEGRDDYPRLRTDYQVEIEKGWNHIFVSGKVYDDCYSFYWSYPSASRLELSPNKRRGDDYCFARSEILDPSFVESLGIDGTLPEPFDETLEQVGGWRPVSRLDQEGNPARRSVWDSYGEGFEVLESAELEWKRFPINRYPFGFSLLLDLGCSELALPELEIEGAAGAVIDLSYSERLASDGIQLLHTHFYTAGDRILPSRGKTSYLSSQARGIRYARLTVRSATGDVVIRKLRFRHAGPPSHLIGSFECSDSRLNEIWKMCERTQRSSIEDVFVDCPGRERSMYLRDVYIQFHNTLAAYGDTQIMRRCVELLGQSADASGRFRAVYPNTGDYTIADFSMEAVGCYWAYFKQSGDLAAIRRDWAAILRNIEWFSNLSDLRSDGFLDAGWTESMGVEARYGSFHGDNGVAKGMIDRSGPNAHLTFPYLMMLETAANLALVVGDLSSRNEFERRHRKVLLGAREAFWDPASRRYKDSLSGDTFSVHASLLAVYAGVASEAQIPSIREYVERALSGVFVNGFNPDDGVRFSPGYSFFIFASLYRIGLYEKAESLIREGWGWMLDQGLATTPEFFGLDESHCHAWSASPMYYLSKMALGVRFPKAPDFSYAVVEVRSNLDWAKGRFPIPNTKRSIGVDWSRDESGELNVWVEAPPGVRVEVVNCDTSNDSRAVASV